MASFLSVDNLKQLISTIGLFVHDTYGISIQSLIDQDDFERFLVDVMNSVDQRAPRTMSTKQRNKNVILIARDFILDRARSAHHPAPQSHPAQNETAVTIPVVPQPESDDVMPSPIDRIPTKTEEDDSVFFQRLQELEQKRKAPPVAATPLHVPVHPPTTHTLHMEPPQVALPPLQPPQVALPQQQAPQQAPQVVVAMPPVARQGTAHVISSWERQISENPERAAIRWTMPLPTSGDQVGTRITGLFLPVSFSAYTPHISIVIEGAGGSQTSCIVAPDHYGVVRTKGWMRWTPLEESLSYIKSISSPWTVQLKTADGVLLPLGLDHYYVSSITIDITNKSALLSLSSSLRPSDPVTLSEADFQCGDQVWIYTRTERKKTEVLSVKGNSIEVRYSIPTRTPTLSNAAHDWMNARLLNYSRQWSVILDITVSEHKK